MRNPRPSALPLIALLVATPALPAAPEASPRPWVPRFPLPASGLGLERHTRSGMFFDVVGRKSAAFGYEHRAMEAWAYPLKLVDDFKLGFLLEGYPLEIDGPQVARWIDVRPEATKIGRAHV